MKKFLLVKILQPMRILISNQKSHITKEGNYEHDLCTRSLRSGSSYPQNIAYLKLKQNLENTSNTNKTIANLRIFLLPTTYFQKRYALVPDKELCLSYVKSLKIKIKCPTAPNYVLSVKLETLSQRTTLRHIIT